MSFRYLALEQWTASLPLWVWWWVHGSLLIQSTCALSTWRSLTTLFLGEPSGGYCRTMRYLGHCNKPPSPCLTKMRVVSRILTQLWKVKHVLLYYDQDFKAQSRWGECQSGEPQNCVSAFCRWLGFIRPSAHTRVVCSWVWESTPLSLRPFLQWVDGLSLRDKVRNLDIWREFGL